MLAANAVSPVQAAAIRHDGGTFWGVQYHPEFSLDELAVILRRRTEALVQNGLLPQRRRGGSLRGRTRGAPRRSRPDRPRLASWPRCRGARPGPPDPRDPQLHRGARQAGEERPLSRLNRKAPRCSASLTLCRLMVSTRPSDIARLNEPSGTRANPVSTQSEEDRREASLPLKFHLCRELAHTCSRRASLPGLTPEASHSVTM